METIFSWVGAALGALFVAAVAVAWWEHLVRSSRPPRPPMPAVPRAVSVDVQLDALAPAEPPATATPAAVDAAPPASDIAQRRATLDGAMSRMSRAGQDDSAWTETSPMVLHPPAEGPAAAPCAAPMPANEHAATTTRA